METIDPKLQSAVWNRVLGAEQDAQEGETVVTAEEVLAWMQVEKDACARYRYLSCKTCGQESAQLRKMAETELCHFRKLHAMYYLLTGHCVQVQAARAECTTCVSEALRAAYQGERQAKRLYEQAAERWPAMADEFYTMAADEDCHSKHIRSMICKRLT